MRNISLILSLSALLFVFSCQNNPKKDSEIEAQTEEIESAEIIEESDDIYIDDVVDRDPSDEELNEFGLVNLVEDAGYPFYYLLIEFPERQMEIYFQVIVENLNYTGSSLEELKGKYISFYYESDLENRLSDILSNGASVFGENGYHDEDMYSVTGILSNAEEVSQGDLPGFFTITTNEGETLEFEYYISEEIVTINNTEVTVYYTIEDLYRINYIRLSEYSND